MKQNIIKHLMQNLYIIVYIRLETFYTINFIVVQGIMGYCMCLQHSQAVE